MSPLYPLTYLPSLFPTDLYFDPLIDVSSHVKTAFEYKQVWNVWDSTLWNLGENIFPKFLKPCLSLLKIIFKKQRTGASFVNFFKTWRTPYIFLKLENSPTLVHTHNECCSLKLIGWQHWKSSVTQGVGVYCWVSGAESAGDALGALVSKKMLRKSELFKHSIERCSFQFTSPWRRAHTKLDFLHMFLSSLGEDFLQWPSL
jgi:hypothetical protein